MAKKASGSKAGAKKSGKLPKLAQTIAQKLTRGKKSKAKSASPGKKTKKEASKKSAQAAKKSASTPASESKAKKTKKQLRNVDADVKAAVQKLKASVAQASQDGKQATSAYDQAEINAEGEVVCREVACESVAVSGAYCRLHYIKNWKKIKRKEMILREGRLNEYVEELVRKYPDKYIEAIRQDLADDKEFNKVVHDLELDEGIDDFDEEGESIDNLIGNIRRDLDDDSEY